LSTDLDDFFNLVSDEADTQAEAGKQQRIDSLVERLSKADHDYYVLDTPTMSDAAYDSLREELEALDPENEYLSRVGAPLKKSPWKKVRHKAPMGSLKKVKDTAEFREWAAKVFQPGRTFVVSDKCDGISISLWYEDGKLVKGVTRGEDGIIGEDITRNALRMKGIVHTIKGLTGELRGEVVLLHEDWEQHFPEMANPRNAASGRARALDGVGAEHLTILHYQLLRRGQAPPNKLKEFKALKALGCAVPRFYAVDSIDDVVDIYEKYVNGVRGALNYDIDGLVIEFDDPEYMESLGISGNRPNGARAYKFPRDEKPSKLLKVDWPVGPTGRLTPRGWVDPVKLAGATVAKASLYNISYIETELGGLCVGDQVMVSRRGDVIPRIEAVQHRNGTETVTPPTECPACGTAAVRDGEFLVCPNHFDCPAQVAGGVKRWITKALGLKGWGDSIIEALCEEGLLEGPADLYALEEDTMAAVLVGGSRIGSTAGKLLADLQTKKEIPLHLFVGSLGIPMCARSVCKTILDSGYDTLEKMQAATVSEIESIPGLGESKARSFVAGLSEREFLIEALFEAGITIKPPADGPLKGMTVCMTGFRDPSMENAVEEAGGTIKSGVSRALSYLVAADPNATTGKAKKARAYNDKGQDIKIVSPDDMWTILGGRPGGEE